MDPTQTLFTRQQIKDLTGLDDTTLNYWSREKILRAVEGREGKGNHRRFDFVQVSIAALLKHLRRFGLNAAALRSFTDLIQEGADLCRDSGLHPGNYWDAASVATVLHRFRNGEAHMIHPNRFSDRPAGMSRTQAWEWVDIRRPAESEEELLRHIIGNSDYDSPEKILAVAERIGPGKELQARMYAEMVYDLLAPGYSDARSWLLGFDDEGKWKIEFGAEGGKFFDHITGASAEDFGSAIFLPMSGILRQVWGLKTIEEMRRERQAERLRERLAERGIRASVIVNEREEDGFSVEAPGVDWEDLEVVLKQLQYTVEGQPEPEEASREPTV